jgi:hypothetical protein
MDDGDDAPAGAESERDRRVWFAPFVGVGPRRYVDLFSMKLGSGYPLVRKRRGVKSPWKTSTAHPRIPLSPRRTSTGRLRSRSGCPGGARKQADAEIGAIRR